MSRKLLIPCLLALLSATWLASCSKDDDDDVEPQPEPVVQQGAPMQILFVFAPGQLGDNGYADRVFQTISMLDAYEESSHRDTVDVNFISTYNRRATREALQAMVRDAANPFYGNAYERRLLVLTEPYMIDWLADIKDALRPTDDVLMLKTSSALIDEAATSSGLGSRLHGMNISAAAAVHTFCNYMKYKEHFGEELFGQEVRYDYLPIFRLYADDLIDYQDSIYVTLRTDLDEEPVLEVTPLSDEEGEGIYGKNDTGLTTMAYNMAETMYRYFADFHYSFAIIDLGAAATGWHYYLFGQNRQQFETLQLDGRPSMLNIFYIDRRFDKALYNWCVTWLMQTAELPQMEWHGKWDGMCEDNLGAPEDYEFEED